MPDPDVVARWRRLCALLDDDPELWPTVRATLEDPPADPWTALLDGLDDAGALAYLDAGDQGEELADALTRVPRVVRARLDLGPVTDTDGDVPTAVRAADAVLAPAGLSWWTWRRSRCRPVVVVLAGDKAEIQRLARELGHYTGRRRDRPRKRSAATTRGKRHSAAGTAAPPRCSRKSRGGRRPSSAQATECLRAAGPPDT